MIGQSTKVGSAHIELVAKTDRFQRGMQDMQDQTRKATARVQNEIRKTDSEIRRMTGSVQMLSGVIAGIGGAAAIGQLIKVADTFTQIRGKLALVVKEGENLADVEERLFQLALKNRAAIEPTVALYSRLRSARTDLTDEQTLKIVDTWNKTLVISGASAGGAAAATIQLSQAMAGGVLRAEEFNSIVENNTRAVQLFASSLGVGMGELRAMVNEGKVTFDALVKAMTEDAGAVGDEFGKMQMTVSQAMTNLETSMIRFVGLQDQQFSGSKQLADWINILAQNFDILATAILAAGGAIAISLSLGLLQSMAVSISNLSKALLAAGSAAKAFGIAMAWLGGPWGIALGAIATAIGAVAVGMMDLRTEAEKTRDVIADANAALASTDEIVKQWELDQAAEDIAAVASSSKEAADSIEAMNAAMARSNKQALIDIQTLKARQLQLQIVKAEAELSAKEGMLALALESAPFGGMPEAVPGNLDQIRALIAELKAAQTSALNRADELRKIPTDRFGQQTGVGGSKPSGDVTRLAGYYTALETYEKELAAIRKESAKGAEGANRAIVQSMMNYLDAGGSVRRVLEDIVALQGNMLDPTSVKHINDFIDAMSVAETINVPDSLETVITDGIEEENETAWTNFEQRVADATKYGLMNAIETGDWGEAFGQILTDITRDALNNALDVLWEALAQIDWGGKGQGWSGFFDMIGASFSGGKAGGGSVSAGNLYRVGEKGSEWFVPNVDGQIIPHDFRGKPLGAPMQVNVGGAQVVIQGDASERTAAMIAESLNAYSRVLPSLIDSRVRDRQMRGAY